MDEPSLPNDPHVFALAGLPGSGKSTAAEIIRDNLEYRFERAVHTEVSDFCHTLYEQEHDGTTDDNDLGRWTAELKEEHGNGYILRRMAETLNDENRPHTIISGLRSPAEVDAIEDVFGAENVTTIAIWTLPDIRFERKYGDTPHIEHEKWDEFVERNERETHQWGAVEFFMPDGPQDYVVPNNGPFLQLEAAVTAIMRDNTGDYNAQAAQFKYTPFPDDLNTEHVASYL